MHSGLATTQVQDEQLSSNVIETRKKLIADFERNHYPLSSLLKERLLKTDDYQFTRKMNELMNYATQGCVYAFAK